MAIILAALSLIVLAIVLQDAFEVMLLPRRVQRRVRLTSIYYRFFWKAWVRAGRIVIRAPSQEGFLSHFGAFSMVGLFVIWSGVLILGFGGVEWALQPSEGGSALTEQIYMSGVTFFTLGYGDVVPKSGLARFVAVLEAGTGLGFIAVVIGYLPVLYQLFARREAHVIQLDGRAGSPPTAAALLRRHAEADDLERLNDLLREWEVWGAELLESHLSYPMLVYYRSQHGNQSWLAAVAAVMDCCALILVGVKDLSPLQARMTFTMARQVVVEMARSFRIEPSRFDGGDRLTPDDFAQMELAFQECQLAWEGGDDARLALDALRATYEPLLDGLSKYLLVPLPGWIPGKEAADHWTEGHRGSMARFIVERLANRGELVKVAERQDHAEVWRRIRSSLRRP
jgi:hypothetical protein